MPRIRLYPRNPLRPDPMVLIGRLPLSQFIVVIGPLVLLVSWGLSAQKIRAMEASIR